MALHERKLGKQGPMVTVPGYGCMGLSSMYGTPKPDEERFALLDYIYKSGQRNWDTADIYGDSEPLLGQWFERNPTARSQIFLTTKFAGLSIDNSPSYIRKACESSLQRLGTDYIDLFYCHRVDKNQPIEVTVRIMKEFQDQGKVRYLGLSEVSAATLRRACKVVHIDAIQMEFNPFAMEADTHRLIAACKELGVALVAYSPLCRGFLTGSIKSFDDLPEGDFRRVLPRFSPENFPRNLELVEKLQEIAREKNCTSGQLVLAWLLHYSDIVIPIPGTTSMSRFDENMAASQIRLTESDMSRIKSAIGATAVHGDRYSEDMSGALLADTVEE